VSYFSKRLTASNFVSSKRREVPSTQLVILDYSLPELIQKVYQDIAYEKQESTGSPHPIAPLTVKLGIAFEVDVFLPSVVCLISF